MGRGDAPSSTSRARGQSARLRQTPDASSAGEPSSSAPSRPEPRDGVSIPKPRVLLAAMLPACCHGDRGIRQSPTPILILDGCLISAQCVRLVFL